jgi:hypothetical protein
MWDILGSIGGAEKKKEGREEEMKREKKYRGDEKGEIRKGEEEKRRGK